jgi:pyruvate kinase
MISALFEAGTDVFRLNFSHGSHDTHRKNFEAIRRLEQECERPIGIMIDLQGPKFRVGEFAGGKIHLKEGAAFRLDMDKSAGDEERVCLPHHEIFKAIRKGVDLLLDDGKIRLTVEDCGDSYADTRVIAGGELSDHKGINLPGVELPLSALTPKDRRDLGFALDLGADWIALSFVQRPDDVAEARKLIAGRAGILVKLEKPLAILHLDRIIELADAVMVARGDLGVEAPPEDVPSLQKQIIQASRTHGKPVVVATQMLESMINSPTPTRAEASDVATAVYDGADAVMLSAETAVGAHPEEAVSMMDRIIDRVERDPYYRNFIDSGRQDPEATAADAITAAARQVAHTISAAAIVTYTTTGSTTYRAARERPDVPIVGLTPSQATARRLVLAWGVHPVPTRDIANFDEMVATAVEVASKEEFAVSGQRLVVTAGVPFGTPGATNVLHIAWVA